ncbi:hypothetical protein SAMN04487777_103911 [Priestia aryabhattai B8W22]|nr:hypothetical protein SAMN04487777_103911 [Priestia aryabhattai B8W22]
MKEFEEQFSELQADMISICMEYIEGRPDKVYIYASCEGNIIASKFFYLINNQYVKSHQVNDALEDEDERYDASPKRGFMVLDILNEDIEKLKHCVKKITKTCQRR